MNLFINTTLILIDCRVSINVIINFCVQVSNKVPNIYSISKIKFKNMSIVKNVQLNLMAAGYYNDIHFILVINFLLTT